MVSFPSGAGGAMLVCNVRAGDDNDRRETDDTENTEVLEDAV